MHRKTESNTCLKLQNILFTIYPWRCRIAVMLYTDSASSLFNSTHPRIPFLYTMLNRETNPAVVNNSSPSTYCFDVEAVNQFFAEEIHVQEFTRYMRMLIYETTRLHLRYCDTASGELSEEVLQAYDYLNGLSEALNPYFTNKNL